MQWVVGVQAGRCECEPVSTGVPGGDTLLLIGVLPGYHSSLRERLEFFQDFIASGNGNGHRGAESAERIVYPENTPLYPKG